MWRLPSQEEVTRARAKPHTGCSALGWQKNERGTRGYLRTTGAACIVLAWCLFIRDTYAVILDRTRKGPDSKQWRRMPMNAEQR